MPLYLPIIEGQWNDSMLSNSPKSDLWAPPLICDKLDAGELRK